MSTIPKVLKPIRRLWLKIVWIAFFGQLGVDRRYRDNGWVDFHEIVST